MLKGEFDKGKLNGFGVHISKSGAKY